MLGLIGATANQAIEVAVIPLAPPEPPLTDLFSWWSPREGHHVVTGSLWKWDDKLNGKIMVTASIGNSTATPPAFHVSGSGPHAAKFMSSSYRQTTVGAGLLTGQGLVHNDSSHLISSCSITIGIVGAFGNSAINNGLLSAVDETDSTNDVNSAKGFAFLNFAGSVPGMLASGLSIPNNNTAYAGAGNVGVWIITLDDVTNGTWTVYHDGWESGSIYGSDDWTGTLDIGRIHFGGRLQTVAVNAEPNAFASASYSEFLIYTSSLSEDDRHDLYNYLTASVSGTGGF